jgi:Uma2 family endonuclease
MPTLPETAWFELEPDWVCEILSPSTARVDRIEKMPIYAAQGVQYIWLVDPELRTLEAFENRQGQWTMIAALEEDNPVSVPPFDAITFDLSVLWAD